MSHREQHQGISRSRKLCFPEVWAKFFFASEIQGGPELGSIQVYKTFDQLLMTETPVPDLKVFFTAGSQASTHVQW